MFIKVHKSEYKKELVYLKSTQRNDIYNNNTTHKNEEIYQKQNLCKSNNIDNKIVLLNVQEK